MRQRVDRANKFGEIPDHPLDESEQDEIVNALTEDATAEMDTIRNMFGVLCQIAAIGCLIVAACFSTNIRGTLHAVLATFFHLIVRHLSSRQMNSISVFRDLTGICLLSVVLIGLLAGTDDPEIHWRLSLGNLFMALGAIYLRREYQSTTQAIVDLHAAKYKFKSL